MLFAFGNGKRFFQLAKIDVHFIFEPLGKGKKGLSLDKYNSWYKKHANVTMSGPIWENIRDLV